MAGMAPPQEGVENEAATPEEQETYDEFILACYALIYEGESKSGQVRPGVLKLLDDDPADLVAVLGQVDDLKEFSPTVAVAATAVVIATEILRRADAEGVTIPDEIIMHGGAELVEELAEIVGKTGKPLTEDELNRAFLMAADLYREVAIVEGRVDEEALKAQFGELVEADKAGKLGQVLPELEKVNQAAALDAAAAQQERE